MLVVEFHADVRHFPDVEIVIVVIVISKGDSPAGKLRKGLNLGNLVFVFVIGKTVVFENRHLPSLAHRQRCRRRFRH